MNQIEVGDIITYKKIKRKSGIMPFSFGKKFLVVNTNPLTMVRTKKVDDSGNDSDIGHKVMRYGPDIVVNEPSEMEISNKKMDIFIYNSGGKRKSRKSKRKNRRKSIKRK